MRSTILDAAAELLEILVYAGGGLFAAALGFRAEYLGVQDVLAGQHVLGLWFVFVGFVAIAVAVTLTRDKFLPAVRKRAGRAER